MSRKAFVSLFFCLSFALGALGAFPGMALSAGGQPAAARPSEPAGPAAKAEGRLPASGALSAARAAAGESPLWEGSRFVELGLEYPLAFGLGGKIMLSDQWHARLGAGFMGEFFLSGLSKISSYIGYHEEAETALISEILKNSLYGDFRLGWAPYFKEGQGGPYLEFGLFHASYGKGEAAGGALNESLGFDLEEEKTYSIKTSALGGSFHAGWQIPFERLRLNMELGLIKIFKAYAGPVRSTATASEKISAAQRETLNKFLEGKKGWIFPSFSLWLGFVF